MKPVCVSFSQQADTSRNLYMFIIYSVMKGQIQFSKECGHIQILSYGTEYIHVSLGTVAHMFHWVSIPFGKWRSSALTLREELALVTVYLQ